MEVICLTELKSNFKFINKYLQIIENMENQVNNLKIASNIQKEDYERYLLIDLNNIIIYKKKAYIQIYEKLLSKLNSKFDCSKINIIAIADANIPHIIDDKWRLNKYIDIEYVHIVPAGIKADDTILSFAREHPTLVITNDTYRDYYSILTKTWVQSIRIPVSVISINRCFKIIFPICSIIKIIDFIDN